MSPSRGQQIPKRAQEIVAPILTAMAAAANQQPSVEEAGTRWRKLVGAKAARHSRPTSLRRGELLVAVDSSAWLWNLSLQRQELLEGLRAAWGPETVKAIRLRIQSA